MGPGNELGRPAFRQLRPVHAVSDVLRQLQNRHAQAQGTAGGIEDPYRQEPPALLGNDPYQVVGAGQAAGQHHGDNAVISLRHDLPQSFGDVLSRGQGGLRQFSRPEAGVDVPAPNVHAVQVLPISAQDAQGHDENMVLLRQPGRQIGAGVCQNGDLLWMHN